MIRDPDALRTVRLFGKPYRWERLPDRRLALARAYEPEPQPEESLAEAVARMFNYPFPWPPEEPAP